MKELCERCGDDGHPSSVCDPCVCPNCSKTFKKFEWYVRHSLDCRPPATTEPAESEGNDECEPMPMLKCRCMRGTNGCMKQHLPTSPPAESVEDAKPCPLCGHAKHTNMVCRVGGGFDLMCDCIEPEWPSKATKDHWNKRNEPTAEELSKLPTADPIKSLSPEDREAWDAYRNKQLPKLKQELKPHRTAKSDGTAKIAKGSFGEAFFGPQLPSFTDEGETLCDNCGDRKIRHRRVNPHSGLSSCRDCDRCTGFVHKAPTAPPAESVEDADAFVLAKGRMPNGNELRHWLDEYATKHLERQTPAIIERFVEEVEKEVVTRPILRKNVGEAMQTVKARREGGEGK